MTFLNLVLGIVDGCKFENAKILQDVARGNIQIMRVGGTVEWTRFELGNKISETDKFEFGATRYENAKNFTPSFLIIRDVWVFNHPHVNSGFTR